MGPARIESVESEINYEAAALYQAKGSKGHFRFDLFHFVRPAARGLLRYPYGKVPYPTHAASSCVKVKLNARGSVVD